MLQIVEIAREIPDYESETLLRGWSRYGKILLFDLPAEPSNLAAFCAVGFPAASSPAVVRLWAGRILTAIMF